MSKDSRASLDRLLAAGGGLASMAGAGLLLGGIGGPWAWLALGGGAAALAGGLLPKRAPGSHFDVPVLRTPIASARPATAPPVEELSALRSRVEFSDQMRPVVVLALLDCIDKADGVRAFIDSEIQAGCDAALAYRDARAELDRLLAYWRVRDDSTQPPPSPTEQG